MRVKALFDGIGTATPKELVSQVEELAGGRGPSALRNDAGQSPLDLAREGQHTEVVALLETSAPG